MRDMFIWRKSVYDNNFKCNQCGAKLFNVHTGRPTDNLVIDAEDADNPSPTEPIYCFCGRCKNAVATWQSVEDADAEEMSKDGNLGGLYSDWLEKKSIDMKKELQAEVEKRLERKYEQKIKALQDQIISRDITIKRLKAEYERKLADRDAEMHKVSKELYHLVNEHDKLRKQVQERMENAEKTREFQSDINQDLGILGE